MHRTTESKRVGDQAGNRDAEFGAELIALTPALKNYARKICGSRDRAEDFVQAAFMKAWASRSSFSSGTNMRGWIFTILRNEIYSHFRRVRVESRWLRCFDGGEIQAVAEPAAAEHDLAITDALRALDTIITKKQRETILAVFLGGATYERVAALLKCPVGTVKSRANRGLMKLRAWSEDLNGPNTGSINPDVAKQPGLHLIDR